MAMNNGATAWTNNAAAVWAHFNEGGALSVDVVSRSEAEELSLRVAELEDEVSRLVWFFSLGPPSIYSPPRTRPQLFASPSPLSIRPLFFFF